MQIRNGQSPPGIDLGFTRRAALGGLLAAILTPTLLAGEGVSPASAQQAPSPIATPIPRTNHSTTIMGDGSVLVAGGTYLGTLSDAQIYNLGNNSWTETGSLNMPRTRHAAALLGGQVLVCGGLYLGVMSDAEVYDPTAGTWTPVAPMNIPRFGHSAAELNGGVIVYGGENLGPDSSPEFYNGNTWMLL